MRPPTEPACSSTTTSSPRSCRAYAAASPELPAPTTATRVTDGVPPCSPVASTPRQGFQVLLEDRGVVEVLVLGAVDQRQTLPPGNVDKPSECRLHIPTQTDHEFQLMPTTDSDGNRPRIPTEADH